MRILMVGDLFSSTGRRVIEKVLPELRREFDLDFVVLNAENTSNGRGLQAGKATWLLDLGIDVLTGGNHTWRFKDIYPVLESHPRVLRPANYPVRTVGRGHTIVEAQNGRKVGVLNLIGRVWLANVGCPFETADRLVEEMRRVTPIILVDVHGEASSEKVALGRYLDGRVTAVVGTHTHVPTADGRIFPGGTAYQTDLGMTGPHDGVIGMRTDEVIQGYLTGQPAKFEPSHGEPRVQGVVIEVDADTGLARSITPVNRLVEL